LVIFEIFTIKLAAAAECAKLVAFEFDVIWDGVNCLNIQDYMTSRR